ncbi:MAG: hypothetical protein HYX63_01545 [Gammaproteobacteria bacterium]|nr:hypothetical protein [Gammaproteobacteria bacterium]
MVTRVHSQSAEPTIQDGMEWTLEQGAMAGERNASSLTNSFLSTKQEWNYTKFNPRAASIGSAKGAAGATGATEVLIANVACFIGGIIMEDDTVAGDVLLRDVASTGQSVVAMALLSVLNTSTVYPLELMHTLGLTVCGNAVGVAFTVKWRPQV